MPRDSVQTNKFGCDYNFLLQLIEHLHSKLFNTSFKDGWAPKIGFFSSTFSFLTEEKFWNIVQNCLSEQKRRVLCCCLATFSKQRLRNCRTFRCVFCSHFARDTPFGNDVSAPKKVSTIVEVANSIRKKSFLLVSWDSANWL